MSNMKSGVELIAEERQRQIEVEKWDYFHDADYAEGELIRAAGCYVANALNKPIEEKLPTIVGPFAQFDVYDFEAGWGDGWPWGREWDKRWKHDKMRSLVIAGALIAAEIDRLNVKQQEATA